VGGEVFQGGGIVHRPYGTMVIPEKKEREERSWEHPSGQGKARDWKLMTDRGLL